MNLPVWLYWEGDRPEWIGECYASILMHSDEVRLVTPEIFDQLRDCDRDIDLSHLCIAHRADFIRAFLLARFGGLYIDADCIVMQSLAPVFNLLQEHDFIAFKQRQGDVSNSFIGAPPNSRITGAYYGRVCQILRSGQPIEWLTIGSHALMASMKETGTPWHQLSVDLIQPICWSNPQAFFEIRDSKEHENHFNEHSFCYMLSNSMIKGYVEANPSQNLLEENTFFSFLLKKSKANFSALRQLEYRKGTDDDVWVIPELINEDMYKVKEILSALEPATPSYIIDCGAHIGSFSIICSLYCKHVKIFSFEPDPNSFAYLQKNAAKFNKMEPVNKAVDIKDGILNLFLPHQKEWTGRCTSLPNSNDYIPVESINLFSFIQNLDKPVFILKLDLEGYEEVIINNVTPEDLNRINVIVLETHTDTFNHSKLTDAGFHLLFQPHISSSREFVYIRS